MQVPRKYFRELAKRSHKKSPRTRAHYLEMQRKSVLKRRANKLSTDREMRRLRAVSK